MTRWTAAVTTFLFCLAAEASHAQAVQTASKEVLLEADHAWNGKPYQRYPDGKPLLTVLKITVAPHAALPWHKHAVPNAAYILSGTLTVQDRETGKTTTVHAGQALAETVDDVHRGVNESDEPVVLVITYAGTAGVPTSTPASGEHPEY
jgi:quercetin dioxygenase-like cupin family protein